MKKQQIDITKAVEQIVQQYHKQTGYIVKTIFVSPFYDKNGKLTQFYVTIEGDYE